MKAQELRIGNYIRYRQEWDCEVESLGHHFATNNKDLTNRLYALQCGSPDIDDYNPIPLTEEWLVKLGFNAKKYRLDKFFYQKGNLMYFMFNTGNETLSYHGSHLPHIKHVHQLQNLYFVLTGKELEVKP